MKKNTWILLLALVVVLSGAAAGYKVLSQRSGMAQNRLAQPAVESSVGEGNEDAGQDKDAGGGDRTQPAPALDFTMYDGQGQEVKLSALYGKPIVLNFWASWCPPCKREMPEFDQVYQEMSDEITFVMVDLVDGMQETKEKGEAYIQQEGFTFPVYYDLDQEAAYAYRVTSIPTTYFIDAQGNVAAWAQGAINKEMLLTGIAMARGEELEE